MLIIAQTIQPFIRTGAWGKLDMNARTWKRLQHVQHEIFTIAPRVEIEWGRYRDISYRNGMTVNKRLDDGS